HGLKIGTISDLIRFRMQNEKTIERVAEAPITTEIGELRLLAFKDDLFRDLHLALVKGTVDPATPTLVRVHVFNPVTDLSGSVRADGGWRLADVVRRVATEPSAVIVILCHQFEPADLIRQIQDAARPAATPPRRTRRETEDLRTIGLGSQILADLGVGKMRVLSAPKRIHSLSGFGLEVLDYVS
ncbi:MAG: bifunctional 3,4-dihydroxy-2-butanone-4-phosphate synthase/GTP cyclohydrolase II, partial [Gammaproteobacteria bacterium]